MTNWRNIGKADIDMRETSFITKIYFKNVELLNRTTDTCF